MADKLETKDSVSVARASSLDLTPSAVESSQIQAYLNRLENTAVKKYS